MPATTGGAPELLGGLISKFNPENLYKAAAAGKPGQDVHASFASMTSQDGKTVTTLRKSDNGVEKNVQFTN
ncbi:hypothetical protein B5X24_HaOG215927 [Helicoverpa armigera]|nr:hypothetical protein B5X24_HaOG215927 [Helicoverpa armigera]